MLVEADPEPGADAVAVAKAVVVSDKGLVVVIVAVVPVVKLGSEGS